MKKLLALLFASCTVFAEKNFEFNPALLVEAEVVQMFNKDDSGSVPKGAFGLGKVEAGFEIAYEKVSGTINYEFDADDEDRILLNEAFAAVSPNEILTISAGQFVNGFGLIESAALSDPLIFDDIETKAPGLQFAIEGDALFGSVATYQGSNNNDFRTFVPAIGLSLNDKFLAKISSRIEIMNDTSYFDMNAAIQVTPIDLLMFQAELYSEAKSKDISEDDTPVSQKALGYYAEIAVTPKEELTIVGRFDQRINDLDANTQSGAMAIEIAGGYQFFEPFCVHMGLTFVNNYEGDTDNWESGLTIQAAFEL